MTVRDELRLPSAPASVGLARSAVRRHASDLNSLADAELLVSELVSNAVQHGGPGITLTISREGDGLLVRVHDEGEGLPKISGELTATSTSGRGLRIVRAVAASWGVTVDPESLGKSVWFRVEDSPRQEDGDGLRPSRSRWSRALSLEEILADIRQRFHADTATVLLLDSARSALEPQASVGLDRTVRRAVRVPLGQGFAGRVAQSREPVILTEVDSAHVLNPVLVDHGVQTLLGVPIMAGAELIGVLHIGSLTSRRFDSEEILRLCEIAMDLAETLRQQSANDAHIAALTLQRSLLPTLPAVCQGMEIAARYVPAEGDLGGDWYDVFDLPGQRLGLVMGDVVGHGLEAAIVMGRLRSALRAYALEHDDPAEVLHRLDREICQFEGESSATVVYGVAEAPFSDWVFSSAGHLAPLIAAGEERPRQLSIPIDPLLGVDPSAPRQTASVRLDEGGMLCAFTDGLVERPPDTSRTAPDIITANVNRLCDVLASARDPEHACVRVLSEVVGDHVAEDDMSILVARRLATSSQPPASGSGVR